MEIDIPFIRCHWPDSDSLLTLFRLSLCLILAYTAGLSLTYSLDNLLKLKFSCILKFTKFLSFGTKFDLEGKKLSSVTRRGITLANRPFSGNGKVSFLRDQIWSWRNETFDNFRMLENSILVEVSDEHLFMWDLFRLQLHSQKFNP